ncbi:hypothetical protein ACHAWO_000848 [Cyclotella atomus]|jgi:hypothetical protein|uniref:Uncharacterized protein n=1 Tax=Cyclotella atomus TaxID=382360 RepID=A0ABD3N0K2_9STRA
MLSIEALLQIHSGDALTPITQSSHTINLNALNGSPMPMTPSLSPKFIQLAIGTCKAAALKSSPGWVCSICRREQASNMCSSILAFPDVECTKLNVTERCYLTCSRGICVEAARSKRNEDSKSGARTGLGFRLAFRCANELIVESREENNCEREE